jgi:hypothetical protein
MTVSPLTPAGPFAHHRAMEATIDLSTLAEAMARRTGLSRAPYPMDPAVLREVADALCDELGGPFSLDEPHPLAIDAELARLRPSRGKKKIIPPLAAYALGAFWGEWLARRRGAIWVPAPECHPVLDEVDVTEVPGGLSASPFNHVCKALRDPEGDALWPKADYRRPHYQMLLIATMRVDIEELGPIGKALSLGARAYREAFDEAMATLDPLIRAGDAAACRAAYGMASVFRQESTALDHAETLARLAPGADSDLCLADAVQRKTGVTDEVLALVRRAVDKNPRWFEPRLRLVYCLGNLGREDEGLEVLDAILAEPHLDPSTRTRARDILAEMEAELESRGGPPKRRPRARKRR